MSLTVNENFPDLTVYFLKKYLGQRNYATVLVYISNIDGGL